MKLTSRCSPGCNVSSGVDTTIHVPVALRDSARASCTPRRSRRSCSRRGPRCAHRSRACCWFTRCTVCVTDAPGRRVEPVVVSVRRELSIRARRSRSPCRCPWSRRAPAPPTTAERRRHAHGRDESDRRHNGRHPTPHPPHNASVGYLPAATHVRGAGPDRPTRAGTSRTVFVRSPSLRPRSCRSVTDRRRLRSSRRSRRYRRAPCRARSA